MTQLQRTFNAGIPTLRRNLRCVEVAADTNFVATVGELQHPRQGVSGAIGIHVMTGQGGYVDEVRAPSVLDVRAPVELVIGVGVDRQEPQF